MRRNDLVQDQHYQTHQYEFVLQVIDYDNRDIDKLSPYTRHLQPMLRERLDDDEVYFSNMIMSHYCFSKLLQQDLKL